MINELYSDITLGSYTPAFFHIHVETEEQLNNLGLLSERDIAIFLHEYTHFLQDVMTLFGIRNILHIISVTKITLLQVINEEEQATIQLPITHLKDELTKTNIDLRSYYMGHSELKNVRFNKMHDFHIRIDELLNPSTNELIRVPYVEIEVYHSYDPQQQKYSFYFGVTAIIESMAYLIEASISSLANPPFFPYRIVEFLAKEIYPICAWNTPMLIALCEISLETYNPAHKFIDILDRMKQSSFVPKNTQDIFEFNKYYTINNRTPSSLYLELLKDAKRELFDILQGDVLRPVREWIERMLDICAKYKENDFRFSSLVENKNSVEVRQSFAEIIHNVGFPLLSNSQEQYWADHHAQIAFKGLIETYKLLRHHNYSSCGLVHFCSENEKRGEDITCENCHISPWARIKARKICSLATLWQIWGIDNKEFLK